MAAITRCVVWDTPYYVVAPSPAQKLEAASVYAETLYEASFQEILTQEEMLQVMIDNQLWSAEEENEFGSSPTRLDALKVEMYQRHASFQTRRVEQARRMAGRLRKRYGELAQRRHAYDMYTRNGLAKAVKIQFLLSQTTQDQNGKFVDLENESEWLLRSVIDSYLSQKPNDDVIRNLSKWPKWRIMWSSGRQEGRVFGVPSTWLTEEQQNLIMWSKLYDGINEHPEPPPEEIIQDNDLLDGWLILEQKRREKEQRERRGDTKGSKPGAQELFIPAETAEDAKRIEAMNEASATFAKGQRMAVLKKSKVVSEQHMPDSKQQISVQAAQEFRDRMKQHRR